MLAYITIRPLCQSCSLGVEMMAMVKLSVLTWLLILL